MRENLCFECEEHFTKFLKYLSLLGIENYEICPELVRGIDYYTRTVFEFVSQKLGAQNSFGGGGRYDNLFSQLGGRETKAIGFALGLERLLLLLPEREKEKNLVFVAFLSEHDYQNGKEILSPLRKKGFSVIVGEIGEKLKAQLKRANAYDVQFTVIVGEEELKEDSVIVKDMTSGAQEKVKKEELFNYLEKRCRAAHT